MKIKKNIIITLPGVLLCLALCIPSIRADEKLRWFRGQLHAHSYWSDGRAFPEQAIAAYRQRGFQFLSLTDHNIFAASTNIWRKVEQKEGSWPPKITQTIFDKYLKTFGKAWVEYKVNGETTSVRLKTYLELKNKFDKPGNFILMPGVEITQKLNKKTDVHCNYINLPKLLPCIKNVSLIKRISQPALTVSGLIAQNAMEAKKVAEKMQQPYLFILNHPFSSYYEIKPKNLIDCPEVHFFEICNNGSKYPPSPQATSYSLEKFWDTVNAFRLLKGHPVLYGIASDDAHFYDDKRIDGKHGVGDAWVMVHASTLTPKHLIEAMNKGDFYASNGVLLEDITYTSANHTLHITVKAEQGVNYRISFITTKKGFDQSMTEIRTVKGVPDRTIPIYSDDIGKTVKTVTGTKAEYQLKDDDLYVRARIESDTPSQIAPHFHPKAKMAWTQPYTNKHE